MRKNEQIKQVLKDAGYNQRMVSVKQRNAGYSSAFDITVRSAGINIQDIKTLLNKFRSIDYCEASGEILQGGNTYINYYYSDKLKDEVMNQDLFIKECEKMQDFYINKVKGNKCGYDFKEFGNKRIVITSYSNVFYENFITLKEVNHIDDEGYKYYEDKLKYNINEHLDNFKEFLFLLVTEHDYKLEEDAEEEKAAMNEDDFLNIIQETNKHQKVIIDKGLENCTDEEIEQHNKSAQQTIKVLKENMNEFIESFGFNWYRVIVLGEDEYVMLWEFGESQGLI